MTADKHPALIALGQQIRKVRKERGLSQEEFAANAGLGRSYYGGVERGERNIAALNLMRIAATLEVEVGALFPPSEVWGKLLDDAVMRTEDANLPVRRMRSPPRQAG